MGVEEVDVDDENEEGAPHPDEDEDPLSEKTRATLRDKFADVRAKCDVLLEKERASQAAFEWKTFALESQERTFQKCLVSFDKIEEVDASGAIVATFYLSLHLHLDCIFISRVGLLPTTLTSHPYKLLRFVTGVGHHLGKMSIFQAGLHVATLAGVVYVLSETAEDALAPPASSGALSAAYLSPEYGSMASPPSSTAAALPRHRSRHSSDSSSP